MNIEKLFLDLTEYLIPHGMENRLEPFLPEGIQMDEVGNYFIQIGESRTMFTCHLDNYCKKLIKVNHVIFQDDKGRVKIKTDGKTPLGSDDKAGMIVMLNMIEHNVPGYYYFFLGEEVGCKGSKDILRFKPEWFRKKFDRCISFDRKGYGSIISKQFGGTCCSREFVKALSGEFAANGMEYKDDPTGRYTDSAVFMYTISEITNLSCGGFNEHTNSEFQNLDYLQRVCNATIKINWEKLPTVRIPVRVEKKFEKPSRNGSYISGRGRGDSFNVTNRRKTPDASDLPTNDPLDFQRDEIESEKNRLRKRAAARKAFSSDTFDSSYKDYVQSNRRNIERYEEYKKKLNLNRDYED